MRVWDMKSRLCALSADTTGFLAQANARDLVGQGHRRLRSSVGGGEQDLEEVVHQTRVDMKRLRALWYLIRPGLADEPGERLHRACRELAQGLGSTRDRQVMQTTLASLAQSLPAEVARHLTAALVDTTTAPAPLPVLELELEQALERYRQLEQLLAEVEFATVRRVHIRQGLEQSFGKGVSGYRRSRKGDDMEALHRWRKWAKVLLYQLEWLDLSPGWTSVLKPLGSCLGDIHDLDVLAGQLRLAGVAADDLALLEPVLAQTRQQRVERALHLGQRAYECKSPARRCRRLYQRWNGGD